MNQLYVGLSREIEIPPGGFLLIADEARDIKGAKIFEPKKDSFNPLKTGDYRAASDFVEIMDALFSRGDSTLTKDTGLDFISECLERKHRTIETLVPPPGKTATPGHIWAHGKMQRILRSPVLRHALCRKASERNLLHPDSKVIARLNRAELGEFDSLALGLFLMANFKGQIILEDGGFYLRDLHTALIRQNRLIVGVNFVAELSPRLRNSALLIEEKVASGATFDDAETLAKFAGLRPDPSRADNPYNRFIAEAMM